MRRLLVIPLVLLGCVDPTESESSDKAAPLVGVDNTVDAADRNCHVVLREMKRNWTGFSWESVVTSTGSAAYVWQGTIEISNEAQAEGLVPRVIYQAGSDPTWREAIAQPITQAPTPGYVRYTVRISEGLLGPGMSAAAHQNHRIQLAPFLKMAGGGRLFDHNRNPNDFDNYLISGPDHAIGSAPNACTPPAGPQRAKLTFAADFTHQREGVLVPGGELVIAYDTARLPTCRHWRNGYALWELTAHVRFEPGLEYHTVSVRDMAATIAVPPTARSMQVWFENTSASGCQRWDSNNGANYRFAMALPPQWVGNVQNLITRGASDPCDGGGPASQGFAFDTWTRQRAAYTNLCFQIYEPGMTDLDDPDLWQKLDVTVKWRYAGQQAWQSRYVGFDRRVGNNARYLMSWRDHDPFRTYHCPEVAPTPVPGGPYVQVALEYYLIVNGGEVRPQPGAAFSAMFVDYANDSWRASNCQ
ncbi:MAG: hypothetical protein H0T89_13905 [Deltaproteobacteria bacterium]|nr:hypothetical protein [Deltaproteobacteria bacterium]